MNMEQRPFVDAYREEFRQNSDGVIADIAARFRAVPFVDRDEALLHARLALRCLISLARLTEPGCLRGSCAEASNALAAAAPEIAAAAAPEINAADVRQGVGAAQELVSFLSCSTAAEATARATLETWCDQATILACDLERLECKRRLAKNAAGDSPARRSTH